MVCDWKVKVESSKIFSAFNKKSFVVLSVLRHGTPDHSGEFNEQIRGSERKQLADKLTSQMCDDFLFEKMNEIEETQEPQVIPSHNVVKTIRKEALHRQDFHRDLLDDAVSRKQKYPYILEVSAAPFRIITFEQDFLSQVEKYKQSIKESDYVYFCLDATGGVSQSVLGCTKSLYYSFATSLKTIGSKKGSTIHLAAMISEAHDQIAIGKYLNFITLAEDLLK